jgi:hypothetical protein
LYPATVDVLAVQDRFTAWIPVPDSASLAGEFVALLVKESLPLTLPAPLGAKVTLKPAFCPADKVRGREGPLTLKPFPFTVSWEMVTLPVPVLVRITGSVLLLPSTTLPKLVLAGLAVISSVIPVPERPTVAGELLALLATEILPVTPPAVVGAKVALKVTLWPEVSVMGSEKALMLKPTPLTVTCETVTLPVPVLVRVTVWQPLLPTVTFPKLRLAGDAPRRRPVTPVPPSVTAAGELVALPTTEMVPLTLPVVVGAKIALKVTLWPEVSVRGSERALIPKPTPLTVACETVTLPVPESVRVTVRELLLPTVTLPKLRVEGLALSSRVTPVPDRETVAGELVASLTTEILPLTLPVVAGAKVPLKDTL